MSADSRQTRAFESFNARFLSAEEVASTFIPPQQYGRLIEQAHSVLFGPRGSGKTTLLKMLQLRSLAAWKHDLARQTQEEISFHSIFLGTDVLWGSQLESRTSKISDEEKSALIRRTSFRLHLSVAILNAVAEAREATLRDHDVLGRFYIEMTRDMEAELAGSLSTLWRLQTSSKSFLGLRTALLLQISDLLALVNKLRVDEATSLPDYLTLEPIVAATAALDLINTVIAQPDRKWAILCDELEIAPEMIREELFRLLRSTYSNVIFKFSFFPYSSDLEITGLAGPDAPSAGNDYTPLDLTYGKREGAYVFCEELLRGMVRSAGGHEFGSPTEVLGEGWFDGGRSHRRAASSPYAPPEGEFYRRAVRLHRNDPTFRRWLNQSSISLKLVHQLDDVTQAPFRKALPFILTRSEFLRPGGNYRSRKSLSLYTGTYSLFSMTEGNPRTFINLMRPIVREYVAKRGGTVGQDVQAVSAEMTIHRFRSSLSAIPIGKSGPIRSILQLIDIVGVHLQRAQLNEAFRPEPPSTFIVDEAVDADMLDLIGRSLNAGAFVRMDGEDRAGITQLRQSRLRLAYTLAPEYKLPLVSGRAINISTIINAHHAAKRRSPEYPDQSRLPFTLESS